MKSEFYFEGASNFRALSGYQTSDGRKIRTGMLYRSEALFGLTAADRDKLATLGLRLACDLRSEGERSRFPFVWPQQTTPELLHLAINADVHAGIAPLIYGLKRDHTAQNACALMLQTYRSFPQAFGAMMAVLTDRLLQGDCFPLLIQCTAGKDRTGFVVAMLMLALGVPMETVMADYLLSNGRSDVEQRRQVLIDILREHLARVPDAAVVDELVAVRPAYLEASFDAIKTAYGSIDAYLDRVWGLTAVKRTQLQALLLQ